MNWKRLLESASESVNDDLRLRYEYLLTENRILCNQIDGRVRFTDSGHSLLPDKAKVVVLAHVYYRPIRDGPIRHRQRFENLSKDDQCKAA